VLKANCGYERAARRTAPAGTVVDLDGLRIGGDRLVLMAGPCAVESEEQILATARAVKQAGAHVLRGGAFKPRTSPYAFRGLGREGLRLLAGAGREVGLPVVTEVMSPHDVDAVAEHAEILQIGARNMQNFALLDEVGRSRRPVLLKRGLSSTIEEWLLAAEYVLLGGNPDVILCERGIRTFETATRNTLDLNAVALARNLSHLPVIADPSHGTGRRELVTPLGLASVAAGAHGLLLEVHPHPESALCDGQQSLDCAQFADLVARVAPVAAAVGRPLHAPVRPARGGPVPEPVEDLVASVAP
jgi:3-deoxy-7-phosphoheptulonate synthase